jgi:hypothetical protein
MQKYMSKLPQKLTAYTLDIPNKERLHDVFHVYCLKKLGNDMVTQIRNPLIDAKGKLILELEGILEVRSRKLHIRQISMYKMKWSCLLEEEAKWELEFLLAKHSSLHML